MVNLSSQVKEKCFTPSKEKIKIDFETSGVKGKISKLTLEVYDFGDTLIAQFDYDCSSSLPTIEWDGTLNKVSDVQKEPFATPLRSPYTLKIVAEIQENSEKEIPKKPNDISDEKGSPSSNKSCSSTKEKKILEQEDELLTEVTAKNAQVEVLYDSIQIVRAPWAANGETYVEGTGEWICNRLNELGYYAGPPELSKKMDSRFRKKALGRFRNNHPDLRFIDSGNILGKDYVKALKETKTAQLNLCCLDQKDWKEIPEEKPLPQIKDVEINPRIFIEAIGFEANYKTGEDEFKEQYSKYATTKMEKEKDKLNRPMIPLEAVVFLKNSSGKAELAPQAVGEVKVDWLVAEPAEITKTLPFSKTEFSFTKDFIEELYYKFKDETKSTNCPEEFGGIRTPKDNWKNPFFLEDVYPPYKVQTSSKEETVWGLANVDPKFKRSLGRAGLIFWPSFIAGDRYQLKAHLSFKGLPNEKELTKSNGEIKFETAIFEVWKKAKISAIVGWPLRKSYDKIIPEVLKEYEYAYIHLDTSQTETLGIEKCLTPEDYKDWLSFILEKFPSSKNEVKKTLIQALDSSRPINPKDECIDDLMALYRIQTFGVGMFSEITSPPSPSPIDFFYNLMKENLRKKHPDGFIVLDYFLGDKLITAFDKNDVQIPTLSLGMADRFLLVDQGVPGKPYFIFAHELGHCFWMRHYENAPDGIKSKDDHDPKDHNCIMSYTNEKSSDYPHQSEKKYSPHFCGKCNLKLRGWNICYPDKLYQNPKDNIQAIKPLEKAIIYFDAADAVALKANQEITSMSRAISSANGTVETFSFNKDANPKTWSTNIDNCGIYHHIGHGNLRCGKDHKRAHVMNFFLPKYPICCQSDAKTIKVLDDLEYKLFNQSKDPTPFYKKLITPLDKTHSMKAIFQWVGTGNSNTDIMMGASDLNYYIQSVTFPKTLAFLSCCLLGWEPSLAKMFIDKGTKYVIAFRCKYLSGQSAEFSRDFYMAWGENSLKPDLIPKIFLEVALTYPHAEPVLFTKDKITRVFQEKKDRGKAEDFMWGDKKFFDPRIPT